MLRQSERIVSCSLLWVEFELVRTSSISESFEREQEMSKNSVSWITFTVILNLYRSTWSIYIIWIIYLRGRSAHRWPIMRVKNKHSLNRWGRTGIVSATIPLNSYPSREWFNDLIDGIKCSVIGRYNVCSSIFPIKKINYIITIMNKYLYVQSNRCWSQSTANFWVDYIEIIRKPISLYSNRNFNKLLNLSKLQTLQSHRLIIINPFPLSDKRFNYLPKQNTSSFNYIRTNRFLKYSYIYVTYLTKQAESIHSYICSVYRAMQARWKQ